MKKVLREIEVEYFSPRSRDKRYYQEVLRRGHRRWRRQVRHVSPLTPLLLVEDVLRFHASSAASFEDAGGDFTRYASKFEDRRDASVFFRSDADNARGLKKLLGEKLYDELIEVIR